MPIDLKNISKTNPKLYSPKFFSKHLTGVGKKTGVLNEAKNPANIISFDNLRQDSINCCKKSFTNGNIETHFIPTNILSEEHGWNEMKTYTNENISSMVKIATFKNNTVNVYTDICVHSLIHETIQNSNDKSKHLHICYQIFIYVQANNSNVYRKKTIDAFTLSDNEYAYTYTNNPGDVLGVIASKLGQKGCSVNMSDITSYIGSYSLYDGVCEASEKWQTKNIFVNLIEEYISNVCQNHSPAQAARHTKFLMCRLENQNVQLDFYKDIYVIIQKYFPNEASEICKVNMNLRLNNTLNSLNANKPQLFRVPTPTIMVPLKQNPPFSPEQLGAITTTEPLVLVQAGAGTGKSTVILGRIDYMVKCGVNPNDILVLSFTNAAANNILDKNPNVKSMTIASMIHDIYIANYSHELSSIETIMNSLEIYYNLETNDIACEFYNILKHMKKTVATGFTTLNNFVEDNYIDVISMLNTINQTCLELEIVICYQQIDNFREPTNIQSKYLIIDEVQDNSVFEFVYTLKYVSKHNAGLFIVGDCSQTLYEFRASNPKALNVLEGSGVFATYQLQVNYRSNQEILDFANIVLKEIEANQYAHIQLQANNLNPTTENSFKEKVNFSYHQLIKLKDLKEAFPTIMANEVKPYIDQKLANKEQVAFLAFTRKQIGMIEEALKKLYPGKEIASLVPDKTFNSTIFSDFIKCYWDELQYIPNIWIDQIIIQSIYAHLPYLSKNYEKITPIVQRMLWDWREQNVELVHNWQIQSLNGSITQDEFFQLLKQNLLTFEIKHNTIRQHLISKRNELNKKKQSVDTADFVLSTIHSAKGLEFDNVVVLYKNENTRMDEDKKRMYYVAFTRAMKSEFILAYDTQKEAKIEKDYNLIIETLQKKATMQSQNTINASIATMPNAIPYITQIINPTDYSGDIPNDINYDFDLNISSDIFKLYKEEPTTYAPAQEFTLNMAPEIPNIIDPSLVVEMPNYIDPMPPFSVNPNDNNIGTIITE